MHGFIPCDVDVKAWQDEIPSVSSVRPSQCPWCGAASRVVGEALTLHGHGLRSRQQWGPAAPWSAPVAAEVTLRRYRCQSCHGVCFVGPRGVERRRLYSGPAIAWALVLFGMLRYCPAAIRQLTSPWRIVGFTAAGTWQTLRRRLRAVVQGRLWPHLRRSQPGASARDVAERVAAGLCAQAPPRLAREPIEVRVFCGASQPAR
ncbi:MAG TPA: hypothetical protein VFH51_05005 [Myxococcota bacterium]|nr:hypothetical protein [Myxococcota bacterium]